MTSYKLVVNREVKRLVTALTGLQSGVMIRVLFRKGDIAVLKYGTRESTQDAI